MSWRTSSASLAAAAFWAFAAVSAAAADAGWYEAVEVLTGDSFKVASGKTVRYASVKAPDLMSHEKRIENYAIESRDFNRRLVEGKKVRLEWGSRIRNTDGSYVAFVFLEDGTLVNQKVLEEGYTKLAIIPPNLEYAEELQRAARHARRDGRGLWQYEEDRPDRDVAFIGDKMKREFYYPDEEAVEDIPRAHREKLLSAADAISKGYRMSKESKGRAHEQRTALF